MPRLLTFPSDDIGFRVVVDWLMTGRQDESIARFERRLRRWSPSAVVRRRELSSEPEETWYVYRDGDAAARRDDAWTTEPQTASARWSLDGHLVWANDAWMASRTELWESLQGRHVTEFLLPEHHGAVQAFQDAVNAGARIHTVGMSLLEGRTATIELLAVREDDVIRTWVRPVVLSSRWVQVVGRARLRLSVSPVGAEVASDPGAAIQGVLEDAATEAAIRRVVAERLPGWRTGRISIEVRSVEPAAFAPDSGEG